MFFVAGFGAGGSPVEGAPIHPSAGGSLKQSRHTTQSFQKSQLRNILYII